MAKAGPPCTWTKSGFSTGVPAFSYSNPHDVCPSVDVHSTRSTLRFDINMHKLNGEAGKLNPEIWDKHAQAQ
jgi:hypothetical protein